MKQFLQNATLVSHKQVTVVRKITKPKATVLNKIRNEGFKLLGCKEKESS